MIFFCVSWCNSLYQETKIVKGYVNFIRQLHLISIVSLEVCLFYLRQSVVYAVH